MSSNFDWLKSYREKTDAGNLSWYDFNVNETKRFANITNSLEEHTLTAVAKALYPNGREAVITLKYRYFYDVSTYGSMSELKINLSLSISDDKKSRKYESATFTHKDFYAKPPVKIPIWFTDAYRTLEIVVKSRKNLSAYMQKLDRDSMAILTLVFKTLP